MHYSQSMSFGLGQRTMGSSKDNASCNDRTGAGIRKGARIHICNLKMIKNRSSHRGYLSNTYAWSLLGRQMDTSRVLCRNVLAPVTCHTPDSSRADYSDSRRRASPRRHHKRVTCRRNNNSWPPRRSSQCSRAAVCTQCRRSTLCHPLSGHRYRIGLTSSDWHWHCPSARYHSWAVIPIFLKKWKVLMEIL